MKKQIVLSVPKSCSQKWSGFTITNLGGFCSTCQKTVVDFTQKSTQEIAHYVAQQTKATCGRFSSSQITPSIFFKVQPGRKLLKNSLFLVSILVVSSPIFSQPLPSKEILETTLHQVALEHTVKGVVKDEDQLALAGVNIYLQGTTVGTVSDEMGKFEFPKKLKEGDVLLFSFVGLETQQYVVPANSPETLEIQITLPNSVMMGEIVVNEMYTKQPNSTQRFWNKVKSIF
jgi:hypothetical protein